MMGSYLKYLLETTKETTVHIWTKITLQLEALMVCISCKFEKILKHFLVATRLLNNQSLLYIITRGSQAKDRTACVRRIIMQDRGKY